MRSLIRRRSDCGYDRAILIVVLLLVSVACGGCDAQTLTSANGPAYTLSSEPIFSIGGHDDRAEYQLQYVIGALHLSSGRVVIADAGPEELRYYDSRGQHEQTAGGAGEGPGEFRNLRSIGRMRGDTVVAWDPRLRRVSLFTPDGEFAASTSLDWNAVREQMQATFAGSSIGADQLHVLKTGDVAVTPFPLRSPAMMEGNRTVRDTVPVFLFDRSGEQVRALGPFPGYESFLFNRRGSLLGFGGRLKVAAGDHVYVTSALRPVIRSFSPTGELERTVSIPIRRRAVTPDDVPPISGIGPMAEFRKAMPVPDSMPSFSSLKYGADDRLWVQKFKASVDREQEWLALDANGNVVASLTMDASEELLDVGSDFALVMVADELDVQTVHLHRLEPS